MHWEVESAVCFRSGSEGGTELTKTDDSAIFSPAGERPKIYGCAQITGHNIVGTGFIVRLEKDAAYIVTASHVIEGDEIETVR